MRRCPPGCREAISSCVCFFQSRPCYNSHIMHRAILAFAVSLAVFVTLMPPGLCPCWLMLDPSRHHPHLADRPEFPHHSHGYLFDLFQTQALVVAPLAICADQPADRHSSRERFVAAFARSLAVSHRLGCCAAHPAPATVNLSSILGVPIVRLLLTAKTLRAQSAVSSRASR